MPDIFSHLITLNLGAGTGVDSAAVVQPLIPPLFAPAPEIPLGSAEDVATPAGVPDVAPTPIPFNTLSQRPEMQEAATIAGPGTSETAATRTTIPAARETPADLLPAEAVYNARPLSLLRDADYSPAAMSARLNAGVLPFSDNAALQEPPVPQPDDIYRSRAVSAPGAAPVVQPLQFPQALESEAQIPARQEGERATGVPFSSHSRAYSSVPANTNTVDTAIEQEDIRTSERATRPVLQYPQAHPSLVPQARGNKDAGDATQPVTASPASAANARSPVVQQSASPGPAAISLRGRENEQQGVANPLSKQEITPLLNDNAQDGNGRTTQGLPLPVAISTKHISPPVHASPRTVEQSSPLKTRQQSLEVRPADHPITAEQHTASARPASDDQPVARREAPLPPTNIVSRESTPGDAEDEAAPIIRVSIGRVTVRATTLTRPAAQPKGQPRPALSLSEYLKRREKEAQ